MSKTKERSASEKAASPTPVAPVLVGFDGSDGARDALELARRLAVARGTRCVVATGLDYGPVSVHRALSDAEGAEAEPLFAEAREALADPDVETHVLGTRSPARMLVDCAEQIGAGSLVVGSPHHRGRMGRALLGSVAEHVLHQAPCEVVVAPRGYATENHEDWTKVAVSYDGTEESKVALMRAEDLAREAGASIELIVAEDPVVSGLEAEFASDVPRSARDVLEAALASVDPALTPTGKRIDPGWRQVVRTIAAGLAEACDLDVGILVAGSRRPMDRFLLGSVTKELIVETSCPVLVVPHRD
jgi:nucleotide-binding universal stress UspA family protein